MRKKSKKNSNKIATIIKNNVKFFVGIIIGIMISGTVVYGATILYNSDSVKYNNTTSGLTSTNVQNALDEIASQYNQCSKYTIASTISSTGTINNPTILLNPGGYGVVNVSGLKAAHNVIDGTCINGTQITRSSSAGSNGSIKIGPVITNDVCTLTPYSVCKTQSCQGTDSSCNKTDTNWGACCSSSPKFTLSNGKLSFEGVRIRTWNSSTIKGQFCDSPAGTVSYSDYSEGSSCTVTEPFLVYDGTQTSGYGCLSEGDCYSWLNRNGDKYEVVKGACP